MNDPFNIYKAYGIDKPITSDLTPNQKKTTRKSIPSFTGAIGGIYGGAIGATSTNNSIKYANGGMATEYAKDAPRAPYGYKLYRSVKRKNEETKAKPPKESPRAKKIKNLADRATTPGEKQAAEHAYKKTMKGVEGTPAKKTHGAWKAAGKLVKTPKRGAYVAGAGITGAGVAAGSAFGVGAGRVMESRLKRGNLERRTRQAKINRERRAQ